MLDVIIKKKVFGDVVSHVSFIEFQKRGLPHIHLLIILKHNYKLLTGDAVDRYTSDENPDPDLKPFLHNLQIL